MPTKYRMYVDEVGNSDLGASSDPRHRYLSLTGIVLGLDYVDSTVFPEIEGLKRRYFGSHPDDPIILHRKELVNKKPPFQTLHDPVIDARFRAEFLLLLERLDYVVLSVVIDKLEHLQKYTAWHFDPYHYCLTVLVERFVQFMKRRGAQGDVMAESRGKKEDLRLKKSFESVYIKGSDFVSANDFAHYLTSRQLKVKPKANNIAGLQLADLIAHPSFKAIQARKNNQALDATFGGEIAVILESHKYDRSPQGKLDGWGRKWLP